MAKMDKRFQSVLTVPKVWQSLLEIESFDDLSLFLQKEAPPEAVGLDGLTVPEWPRPIVNDLREVSFDEDEHAVALQLISGTGNYFAVASVTLPSGDQYAHSDPRHEIVEEERLEIRGVGKFVWRQRLV